MSTTTRAQLDQSYAAHSGRARCLIERRLADARLHALAGTKADAIARLDELSEVLGRHLNDCRTAYCRSAAGQPHAGLEHVARVTPILGRDQQADVRNAVGSAKAGLRGVLIGPATAEQLRHWELTHGAAIGRAISLALSDSQTALTAGLEVVLNEPSLSVVSGQLQKATKGNALTTDN